MNTSGNSGIRSHAFRLAALLLIPASLGFAAASPAGRSTWIPAEDSPYSRLESSGTVVFPCRFTPKNDRCVWDGPKPATVAPAGQFKLTLSADKPELIRAVTLYLKSGDGWYAAPIHPLETTPRLFSFTKESFTPEGNPADWSRIDAIRLAVWKRTEGEATLRLDPNDTGQDRVFVLKGGPSIPEGEQELASTLSRRCSAWLQNAGIHHALIGESDWLSVPPGQTRFLLLPYVPRPNSTLLQALKAVLAKGGKLLVCYGASPELAGLMGFRLAPYQAAPTPFAWSAMRFEPAVGPISLVGQESHNLIPVFPDSDQTRVLAWWEDAEGKRQAEPAWVGGPAGYWMSHVLDSEDAGLKTRVLLEWIGAAAPDAWEQAGRTALTRAAAVLPADALNTLQPLAARKDWKTLVDESRRLRLEGTRRQAAALPPAGPSETNAVWIQPAPGLLPADGSRVAPALRQAGLRRIYLSAVAFGRAHFNSGFWPRSELMESVADPFAGILKAAKPAGLSVHAWVTCFNVAYTPPARMAAWRLAGRLMQTPSGEQPWLTPTHPENRKWLLDAIGELAARHPVDGIQLDYIRFPDGALDISPSARTGFEQAGGSPVEAWPADVLPGGTRHAAYKAWLTAGLGEFVNAVRDRVRQERPGTLLSAAVYPAYPYCRDGVMQDWKNWLENDWVDEVCPMSYTADRSELQSWIAAFREMPGWGSRIFPGIGVFSDTAPLEPNAMLDQLRLVREAGGAGAVFFLANREFLRECLPLLQPALD